MVNVLEYLSCFLGFLEMHILNCPVNVRQSFVPGTKSTLKQIFSNVLLTKILSKHLCSNPIHITNHDTQLECNSLIYTYHNDVYIMFQVLDIENDYFICNQIGTRPKTYNKTPNIRIFKTGPTSSEICHIPRNTSAVKLSAF